MKQFQTTCSSGCLGIKDKQGNLWWVERDYEYEQKIDIANKTYLPKYEKGEISTPQGYSKAYADSDLPLLKQLIADGTLEEYVPYEVCKWEAGKSHKKKHSVSVDAVRSWFRRRGYNVTRKAILHNLNAYEYKTGYRDEKNGYHLFSVGYPNPINFYLTTLHESCEDWQYTYGGWDDWNN